MAISTYTELKTSLVNWLHIPELSSLTPDFISLAEATINRRLKARVFLANTDLTVTTGSRFIDLPSDYLEPRALWLTTWEPRQELVYKTAETLPVTGGSAGVPVYWAIEGNQIALDIEADQAHTFTFRYRQRFSLSSANPTNWLLTNHPDVYLYASLLSAAGHVRDNEQLAIWKQAFDIAIDEVEMQDNKTDQLHTLGMDFGGRRTTIYEGN